jgi:hypothetical protein
MKYTFKGTAVFNQPLPWDTSKVTQFDQTFAGATAFNQPLPWDTSKVYHFDEMFSGASAFNQALNFKLSSVASMQNIFENMAALSDCNKKAIADVFAPQTSTIYANSPTYTSYYGSTSKVLSYSYGNKYGGVDDTYLTSWSSLPICVAAGPCGDGYAVVENGLKLKKKLKKLKKVKTIVACAAICKKMGTCGGFHFKAKAKVSCSLYKSGVSKNKCKKKRTCCEKSP